MGSILRFLRNHRYLASAAAAAAIGGSTIMAVRATAGTPPPSVTLQTVDSPTLAKDGITLRPPLGAAALDKATAEQLASKAYPGATIREAVLAEVEDTHTVPVLRRRAWVVSILPPGGIRFPSSGPFQSEGTSPPAGTYFLVLYDADSGQFIEGTIGPAAIIGPALPLPTLVPAASTPALTPPALTP